MIDLYNLCEFNKLYTGFSRAENQNINLDINLIKNEISETKTPER